MLLAMGAPSARPQGALDMPAKRYRIQLMSYTDNRPFGGTLFQSWAVWDRTRGREVGRISTDRKQIADRVHEMNREQAVRS